jgi:hypothetical protein
VLDFVGKPSEMLMQPVEYLALRRVRGEVTDQRGFCRVAAQLVERCLIIPHHFGATPADAGGGF